MAQSNEYSFPFDAEEVDGSYDRVYVADEFAQYFRAFITSGVFMDPSSSLQVVADSGMNVTVSAGQAIIEGYRYELESDMTVTVEAADGTLNRIDRICITWDKEARDIHVEYRKGTASYNPVAPARRWTAEYKDLVSADIYVAAGAISITQANITDQRLNSTVCGLATPWEKVDTTALYNQIESELNLFKTQYEGEMTTWTDTQKSDFSTWFTTIKDLLDTETAGHLLNEINDLKDSVASRTQKKTTVRQSDGSIKETLADGRYKTTARNSDGSITETFCKADGTVIWTNKTTRQSDGSIVEEVV